MSTQLAYAPAPSAVAPPAGLPRLLTGIAAHAAMSLEHHEAVHGPLPLTGGRRPALAFDLVEELDRAGLRGRGGAGFPTAAKLRAVAAAGGRPVVLANVGEGEPASRKDRTLARMLPHLVLDGAELAARALGARELIVAVCETARTGADTLALAISERERRHRGAPRTRLLGVPDRFVASQESALVSLANGAPALPAFTPPRPFERGVGGHPTLVANAETLAHVALIARHGASWFRELGSPAEPGSALVTLSGPVARPGVYEIARGGSLSGLMQAAGGLTLPAAGVLLGGYGGAWIAGAHLESLRLSDERLAPFGASLGAGVVAVLSAHACPVRELARLTRWLAGQSAGQCGPCVHGLDALAGGFEAIAAGAPRGNGEQRMRQLAALVRARGACAHPDGVARMALSALAAFPTELAEHARHGPCERCARSPELPLARA